jgi:hypothetical protein
MSTTKKKKSTNDNNPHGVGEGFHKERMLGMARNDFLGTIGLAIITAAIVFTRPYYKGEKTGLAFWGLVAKHFVVWFLIGVLFHLLFGVETAFIRFVKTRIF